MVNAWQAHIKDVAKKNPGMKFKDVLKAAAKTYKKSSSGVSKKTAKRKTGKRGKGKKGKKTKSKGKKH